jgi:hypothetical protein
MNEITILIIGIGIGYFWAMFRKDNINVTVHLDVNDVARKLEYARAKRP